MKVLFITAMIAVLSCHCSRKTIADNSTNTVVTERSEPVPDSLPKCIKALIKQFSSEERTNPPRKIFSYAYKGATVYYVPPVCCDNFSDLYDDSCKLIGHPDGGFTGRGDGKAKDFSTEKSNEKLVWEDRRK